jgi:hypothetical protein
MNLRPAFPKGFGGMKLVKSGRCLQQMKKRNQLPCKKRPWLTEQAGVAHGQGLETPWKKTEIAQYIQRSGVCGEALGAG